MYSVQLSQMVHCAKYTLCNLMQPTVFCVTQMEYTVWSFGNHLEKSDTGQEMHELDRRVQTSQRRLDFVKLCLLPIFKPTCKYLFCNSYILYENLDAANSLVDTGQEMHELVRRVQTSPCKQCGTGKFPYSLLGIQLPNKNGVVQPPHTICCIFSIRQFIWYLGCSISQSVQGIELPPNKKALFNPLILFFCMFSSIRQLIWYLGCCISYSVQGIKLPTKKVQCQLARVANSGFHKSSFHQDRPKAKKHHGLLSKPVKTYFSCTFTITFTFMQFSCTSLLSLPQMKGGRVLRPSLMSDQSWKKFNLILHLPFN